MSHEVTTEEILARVPKDLAERVDFDVYDWRVSSGEGPLPHHFTPTRRRLRIIAPTGPKLPGMVLLDKLAIGMVAISDTGLLDVLWDDPEVLKHLVFVGGDEPLVGWSDDPLALGDG